MLTVLRGQVGAELARDGVAWVVLAVGSSFEDTNRVLARLAELRGDGQTSGTGANNDVVVRLLRKGLWAACGGLLGEGLVEVRSSFEGGVRHYCCLSESSVQAGEGCEGQRGLHDELGGGGGGEGGGRKETKRKDRAE